MFSEWQANASGLSDELRGLKGHLESDKRSVEKKNESEEFCVRIFEAVKLKKKQKKKFSVKVFFSLSRRAKKD